MASKEDLRKTPAASKKPTVKSKKCRDDEAVMAIIHGLDLFIAQASSAQLGMAARILYNAKEELVMWAVDMDFHETVKDKFINRHLYNNGLFAASDCIVRFLSMQQEEPTENILTDSEVEKSHFALMKALRKVV